jgi:hypothetical protein
MIERGDVVCLNDFSVLPASLFYIDDNGSLICRDKNTFRLDGAKRIIDAFNLAVSQREYRRSGGKPAPTSSRQLRGGDSQSGTYGRVRETLNSKNVGRLLAAGGVYNGNASLLDSYHEIQIPAGTKVYVGEVGYQTDLYSGGTEQVVVPTPWKIPGVKILGNGG